MRSTKQLAITGSILIAALLCLGCQDTNTRATTADIKAVRASCAVAGAHPDHPVMATVFTTKRTRLGEGPIGAAMPGDPVGSLFCKPWGSGH